MSRWMTPVIIVLSLDVRSCAMPSLLVSQGGATVHITRDGVTEDLPDNRSDEIDPGWYTECLARGKRLNIGGFHVVAPTLDLESGMIATRIVELIPTHPDRIESDVRVGRFIGRLRVTHPTQGALDAIEGVSQSILEKFEDGTSLSWRRPKPESNTRKSSLVTVLLARGRYELAIFRYEATFDEIFNERVSQLSDIPEDQLWFVEDLRRYEYHTSGPFYGRDFFSRLVMPDLGGTLDFRVAAVELRRDGQTLGCVRAVP